MRRTVILISLMSVVLAGAPVAASDAVVFTGSGWGHGVGLSQYGARGMAASGASTAQILGHYYSGTSLGTVDASTVQPFVVEEARPLWVGLMQNQTTVTFSPRATGATLCFESGGSSTCLPAAAAAGERWRFRVVDADACVWEREGSGAWTQVGASGPCRASVTPTGAAGEIDFYLLGRRFGDGILRLRKHPSRATVHAVWQTALEPYLRGIAEMPSSWSATALGVQAIAARSYAVARVGWRGSAHTFNTTRQAACYCNLYMTTNDQQFLGKAAEAASWVSAVGATAGQIVVSGGKVAETFYSSSSGGRTESNQHYWGGSAISYLQGVDDSAAHTVAAANPFSSWSASFSPATVASRVGFDTLTAVRVAERHPSGSPSKVEFTGTKGSLTVVTNLTGNQVRSRFGLRSQYVSVDWRGGSTPPPTTQPPATTTTTTTTTQPPATTPTTTTTTTTTTTSPEGSTTTVPDNDGTTTSTTVATTSTTTTTTTGPTTGPDEGPVTVDPPDTDGGRTGPITNKPPEPKGTPEDIAPPPSPAPEVDPEVLRSGEDIDDTPLGSVAPFGAIPASNGYSPVAADAPPPTEVPPPPPVEVAIAAPELGTTGVSAWRAWAYEVASSVGAWIARTVDRLGGS